MTLIDEVLPYLKKKQRKADIWIFDGMQFDSAMSIKSNFRKKPSAS